MMQLGNLAIICARRPDLMMQLYDERVFVHVGEGHERETLYARWDDDAKISSIIHELNFGKYQMKRSA